MTAASLHLVDSSWDVQCPPLICDSLSDQHISKAA